MIKYLWKLSRIGVTDEMSERDVKGVVGLNVLILTQVPLGVLSLLLISAYLPATQLIFIVVVAHIICIGLTLLWRHYHHYLAARIWFGFGAAFFFTLETALLGTESRFHLFLILGVLSMFYRFQQRSWSYLLIGLYCLCFIAAEILFRDGGLVGDIQRDYLIWQSHLNSIVLLLFTLGHGILGWRMLGDAEERLARDNEVIQENRRQLEIANKYKSHYIASASHDLRQPLHALNMFVGQLHRETDPTKRNRLIERIDATIVSMNELFGGLLDMTKLEAGILEPHVTEFPVARLLRRIETTFADVAREKGLRLRVVPTHACVRSDVVLLERILLNLVSNAVRYTARGGIVVGCRRRGAQLRIDVCDTGPGIPENQQMKIFGEYYQVERHSRGGLGLGLAIVDRLGNLLAHPINLVSRSNRGTRFSVSVPLIAKRPGAAGTRVLPAAIVDPLHGKVVVLIDDDALVLDGMAGILRSWGCVVVAGDSAAAALSQLAGHGRAPDIIISDYRLTGGDTGLAAIARLREAWRADIPAFLISGDTAPERLRDASDGGFHLLHKPVTAMRLRTMLNQILRSHRTDRAPPAAE